MTTNDERPGPAKRSDPWRAKLRAWVERTRVAPRLLAAERFILGLPRAAMIWLGAPAAYAAAIAFAVWGLSQVSLQAPLATNKVPFDERVEIVSWAGWILGAILITYALVVVAARLIKKEWDLEGVPSWLNLLFAWVLALPVAAVFSQTNIESTDPIWTIVLAVAAAVAIAVSVYAAPALPESLPSWSRHLRYLAPLAVVALGAFYAWRFSTLSVTNHHALNTRTIDLGYYDNIFYQSIHGRPLGCTFMLGETHASGHFDPILVLLSPLYLIYPRAELLLVLQSVWLATGVIPLYLLVRHVLGSRGYAVILCIAYVLYPAMHGANMYEFHSLTLITPLLIWLLYFLESRRIKSYWVMLVLLWLCREDIPLLTCFVGLYAVTRRDDGLGRVGWITIAASLVYFVVVKKVFMTSGDVMNQGEGAYGFAYYFADLIPEGKGLTELLLSLLTNPLYALQHAFADPKKILYLLILFAPLGFLPFFAKRMRWMLFYGLFIVLVASREPVFQASFQYSSWIFPIAFACVPVALRRIEGGAETWARVGLDGRRLVRALVGFILAASVLVSWKFGAITENTSFRGGFGRIARELTPEGIEKYEAMRRMVSKIEPDASVTVTNMVGPHVTGRAKVYLYRQKKETDYVFVYEREIKDWRQTWHQERIKDGGLVEIDAYRTIKLYRVDRDKDVSWQEGYERHKKKTQPRTPPKPRGKPTSPPPAAPPPDDPDLDPEPIPDPD